MTTGTGQRRPVQCLEEVVDETVVTARMICQRLSCNHLIRSTDIALWTQTPWLAMSTNRSTDIALWKHDLQCQLTYMFCKWNISEQHISTQSKYWCWNQLQRNWYCTLQLIYKKNTSNSSIGLTDIIKSVWYQLLQLIRDLHTGTTARVRTSQGMSDVFSNFRSGRHHVWRLSLVLSTKNKARKF